MDVNEETFDRLISQIFSAAMDSSQWQVFLDTLGAVSGGVRTHILGHDLRLDFSLPTAFSGYGKEHIDSWNAHFGFHNAWASGFGEALVGQTIPAEAMCTLDVLHRTEFYNDWVRPQEDISSGGGVVLAKNEASFFALGGNIRARDQDTLQVPFLALVQRLTPHLQNALAISRRIGGLQIENAALARAGVGADAAVLVLDGTRRLIHANAAAQARLARGTILRSDLRGRVSIADASANRRLAEALAELGRPGGHVSSAFRLPADGQGPDIQCRLARLDLSELVLHRAFATSGALREPCLLVTLSEAFCARSAIGLLMGLHGLTRAEAEVAAGVAAGRSLRELAEVRGTSHHTVRNQFKLVLSKTHQHSQRDLTRLVLQLAG